MSVVENHVVKKSELTRERILDTALELFQELGFEKTTMRAIAEACDLSLGAAYYHFKTKEELVLHFYARTAEEARAYHQTVNERTTDFKDRFRFILAYNHQQLAPYKSLVGVLARQAIDMDNPLSPFSTNTKPLRDDAIQLIEEAIAGTNLRVSTTLRPQLAKILWLYQMGIIWYWANDGSEGQRKTTALISVTLDMVARLLRLSTMPFMNAVNQSAVKVVKLAETCVAR